MPSGILEHVPEDGVGDVGVVVAHPDAGTPDLVLGDDLIDPLHQIGLGFNDVIVVLRFLLRTLAKLYDSL